MKNKIVPALHIYNDIESYIHKLKCMNKTKGKEKYKEKAGGICISLERKKKVLLYFTKFFFV